jgi:DNA mismatch endonuclease (patch repair protein)
MDNLTAAQRTLTMKAVRGSHTTPEWIVRKLVFSMGYRYRLHSRALPGCPDLVFPARRKVIFVHGCFWHGHSCPAGLNRPKSNTDYWGPKLERNLHRDKANRAILRNLGWKSLVLWECELSRSGVIQRRIKNFLDL